jgi:membrane protein
VTEKLRDSLGFLRFVLKRWSDDRCPQIAGSLTYTTLLALVPMFAIAVAWLSSAPLLEHVMSKIKIFLLLNLAPEIAGKIITVYMEEFAQNAARLTRWGIAIVLALAVWLMLIMDRSINAIWRVRPTRPWWVSALGYAALLVTGPILLGVSVTVTTYIMSLSVGITGLSAHLHAVLLRAVPVAMSAIAFFLVYRIVPHRAVPWRHALLGGATAALLFEAAKEIFSVYARAAPTYNIVYGAFAAVPLFLVWLYLSWLVMLFGAELTAAAAYWRGGLWKQAATPGMRFREAAAIVRALIGHDATTMSFEKLRAQTGLPADELEETLAQMVDGGVLRRAGRHAYALAEGTRELLIAPRAAPQPVTPGRRGKARSGKSSR